MEANQLPHGTVGEEIQVSCRTHNATPYQKAPQTGAVAAAETVRLGRDLAVGKKWLQRQHLDSCCNDREKWTKHSEGSAARAGRNARWCRKSREGWRRAAVGSPFGTATHRYRTATRSCTLPWSAWLCVPAVCCWKAPGWLRVGEWKSSNICRDSTRQAQCDSCVIVQQTDAEQSTAGPGRSDQGEVESAHEIRHSRRTEHETQHVQQLQEILPACLHRKAHNQPERNTLAIDDTWKNCTADAWRGL